MIVPKERNGPNGISDLIVRLFLNRGKLICDLNLLTANAKMEKAAPIQKANITAESPEAKPSQKPITKMYLMSPKPIQRPFEIMKIARKGKVIARPEARDTRYEM